MVLVFFKSRLAAVTAALISRIGILYAFSLSVLPDLGHGLGQLDTLTNGDLLAAAGGTASTCFLPPTRTCAISRTSRAAA